MKILGVNKGATAFGKALRHGGAALATEGRMVAVSEERVTGRKYAGGYTHALGALRASEGTDLVDQADLIGISSCCETEQNALRGHDLEGDPRLVVINHHLSHAALAFYPSRFDKALVVVADGGGNVLDDSEEHMEWWRHPREQLTYFVADRARGLELIGRDFERPYDVGLGEMYRAFTYFLGWHSSIFSSRTMALAGHGRRGVLDGELFALEADRLVSPLRNDPNRPIEMVSELARIMNVDFGEPRTPRDTILQVHKDVAAFIQSAVERALVRKLQILRREYRLDCLCVAGGLALNVVANARLLNLFSGGVYVPSAPADDGQCLGNVYALLASAKPKETIAPMVKSSDAFLGPDNTVNSQALAVALAAKGAQSYVVFETSDFSELLANMLAAGSTVCLYQSRSEFGPRALGSRSILADPRRNDTVSRLNSLKNRDWFMPFAPAVLAERMSDWFEPDAESPFMSFALSATPNALAELPAVVNLDGTARVQTVHQDEKGQLRSILSAFQAKTGIPVLLNTSFNLGGAPIVESIEQAISSFKEMPINVLGIGRFVVLKTLSPDLKDLPVASSAHGLNMEVYQAKEVKPDKILETTASRTIRKLQSLTKSVVFVRTELPLYEQYLDWLREGRKVTTIRFRKGAVEIPYKSRLPLFKTADFGPGDRSRPTEIVEVTALRYHRFGELSEDDARRDGFGSYDHMRKALTEIYKDLADGDWVTVYDIRLVDVD